MESEAEETLNDMEDDELQVQLEESTSSGEEEETTPSTNNVDNKIPRSPDGEVWKSNPPNRGQRPARSVIRGQPGATPYTKAIVHDEISAFKAVFDTSTVETIAMETIVKDARYTVTILKLLLLK